MKLFPLAVVATVVLSMSAIVINWLPSPTKVGLSQHMSEAEKTNLMHDVCDDTKEPPAHTDLERAIQDVAYKYCVLGFRVGEYAAITGKRPTEFGGPKP